MADLLSIPNLLSLLEVDQRTDQQKNVLRLCYQAEGLRRRRLYGKAIEVAGSAAQIAQNDFNLLGVALLYLGVAHFSSSPVNRQRQAIPHIERAIRSLSLQPSNSVIALICRAQVELVENGVKHRRDALDYLSQAERLLRELITESRQYHRLALAASYTDLYNATGARIKQLEAELIRVEPRPMESEQAEEPVEQSTTPIRSTADKSPVDLGLPTRRIWPPPDLDLEYVPIYGAFTSGLELPVLGPAQMTKDYLEVNRLSLKGKPYAVHSSNPASDIPSAVKLYQGQQYIAVHGTGNNHSDDYALIRQEPQIAQASQPIMLIEPIIKRLWVIKDNSAIVTYQDFDLTIIGGADSPPAPNQAERNWSFVDGTDVVHYGDKDLRILGVVEAILTPADTQLSTERDQ